MYKIYEIYQNSQDFIDILSLFSTVIRFKFIPIKKNKEIKILRIDRRVGKSVQVL